MRYLKKRLVSLIRYSIAISCLVYCPYFWATGKQSKRALIIGITGQDGSYLAQLLLNKDYLVHGTLRSLNAESSKALLQLPDMQEKISNQKLFLHEVAIHDKDSLKNVIYTVKPDEIYNLAAQSHVGKSFTNSKETQEVNAFAVFYLLETIQLAQEEIKQTIKYCQASTSEIFDSKENQSISESSIFYPRSPYGVAKLYAHWITINYRDVYKLYSCNAILFNHESPRRGKEFVTRKITQAVARHACGSTEVLSLGNLDSSRDWGFAGDYVEAMWLMLQQPTPDDFVIATGETHTVREFVEKAYAAAGITISWQGSGLEEKGINAETQQVLIQINPDYFRPQESLAVVGDTTKAKTVLKWQPKTSFDELVKHMVQFDIENAQAN